MPTFPLDYSRLDHYLNPKKGHFFSAVQVSEPIGVDPAVTLQMRSGMVAFKDPSTNLLRPGVHNTALTWLVFSNANDEDVVAGSTAVGPSIAASAQGFVSIGSGGLLTVFAANSGGIVETTEYDTNGSYTTATTLTAAISNSNQATGGVVTPGTPYAAPICGVVVSAPAPGPGNNWGRPNVLTYAPVWLPKDSRAALNP